MNIDNKYGFPLQQCEEYIAQELSNKRIKSTMTVFYQGKSQDLPVIEVPIQLPLYRISNIRTKNLQKEWLVNHPDYEKEYFKADPYSIAVQEIQHSLLKGLVLKDKDIFDAFKKELQTEPIICASNGIVLNGNRRLCVWRELYYHEDSLKYSHFQVVRVAVLPNSDEKAMYDLEIQLQVKKDIKADYVWHAIAADCYEQESKGVSRKEIANKQSQLESEIGLLIECYEYAKEFLEVTGNVDKWSLVDDKLYAFKPAISSRKKISDSGKKQLFEELFFSVLQVPAQNERLYEKIPKIEKNLSFITTRLKNEFPVSSDSVDDDMLLLSGGKTSEESQLVSAIKAAKDPIKVVNIVEDVIKDSEELEKEKKKTNYVLMQVQKAATLLTNTLSFLYNDEMSKDGVEQQLESIEVSLEVLRNWVNK